MEIARTHNPRTGVGLIAITQITRHHRSASGLHPAIPTVFSPVCVSGGNVKTVESSFLSSVETSVAFGQNVGDRSPEEEFSALFQRLDRA
jgi:hypothetical protein